jgi:serine/threonine protein kinase
MDIPGFKLGREFADGEYCRRYNALNLGDHKTVSIQVFDSSLVANQEFSNQFRDVTSKLVGSSFGIMSPILQAEISNQACYVISKYFPSPQQLSATPPTLTKHQILVFALQLAQTLDQLHSVGLVHGGIEYNSLYFKTPNQLMLRPVILQRVIPTLRPITFKSLDQAQKRYLAPEVSEGLTPATDFYALGVLLYHLIFGPLTIDKTSVEPLEDWPFVGDDQDLEYFFKELLAPDPGQRIQSLDQFTEVLERCGVDLLEIAPTVSNTTSVHHRKENGGETASRSFSKWMILTAGLAVSVLAGTQVMMPAVDEAQQQREPVAVDASEVVPSDITTNVETNPVEQPTANSFAKIELAETSPSVAILYQQALTQMEANPEIALQIVKVLLEQEPVDTALLKLEHQIKEAIEIRSLINTAKQQLKEEKLLQPSGDNAYESYQALAEKLSFDDERVRSGFTDIANAYHTLAENLFKKERIDNALELVERGLSVKDDYAPLLKLRITINEEKDRLQDKQKLVQQEKQRKREKQAKILAEQVVEKESRVDALLRSANDQLNNGRPTLKKVFAAHLNYDELLKLDSTSQRVTELKKALINAYVLLSQRESNDKLYKKAIQSIEQDVQMNPQDKKKLQIRSQLSFSSF